MPDNNLTVEGTTIGKLKYADYMFANDTEVTGSQNIFFDKLYSTVRVHTSFNGTPTTFDCKTLRVWIPPALDATIQVNGLYYLRGFPSDTSTVFAQGSTVNVDGATVDFRDLYWEKTESPKRTIKWNTSTSKWELLDSSNVSLSNMSTISTFPITGSYTNLTGTTVFPLIVWSTADEPEPTFKNSHFTIAVSGVTNDQGIRSYGFTPYIVSGGTCTVKWGDGNEETFDDSASGCYIKHTYSSAPTEYTGSGSLTSAYLVEVDTNIENIIFGFNRGLYDISNGTSVTEIINGSTTSVNIWTLLNNRGSLTNKGSYSSGSTYNPGDIVTGSDDKYYICLQFNNYQNPQPPSVAAYWELMDFNMNDLVYYTNSSSYYVCINNNISTLPGSNDWKSVANGEYSGKQNPLSQDYRYDNNTVCTYNDIISGNTITNYYLYYYNNTDYNRPLAFSWSDEGIDELEIAYCMFNECSNIGTERRSFYVTRNNQNPGSYTFNQITSLPPALIVGDYMFADCSNYTYALFNGLTSLPSSLASANCMFYNCSAVFANLTSLGSSLVSANFMFNNCGVSNTVLAITSLPNTLVNVDYMFSACYGLNSLNFNTNTCPLLINGSNMFNNCYSEFSSLTTLPANLTFANHMFDYCSNALFNGLTSLPNTLVDATAMFSECYSAEFSNLISLGNNLKYADQMFYECGTATFSGLTGLSSTIQITSRMFENCYSAEITLSNLLSNNYNSIRNKTYTSGELRSSIYMTFNNDSSLIGTQNDFFDQICPTGFTTSQVNAMEVAYVFDDSISVDTNIIRVVEVSGGTLSGTYVLHPEFDNLSWWGDTVTYSKDEMIKYDDNGVTNIYKSNSNNNTSLPNTSSWTKVLTSFDDDYEYYNSNNPNLRIDLNNDYWGSTTPILFEVVPYQVTDPIRDNYDHKWRGVLHTSTESSYSYGWSYAILSFDTSKSLRYSIGTIVSYDVNGITSGYKSLVDNNSSLPTDTSKWQLIASEIRTYTSGNQYDNGEYVKEQGAAGILGVYKSLSSSNSAPLTDTSNWELVGRRYESIYFSVNDMWYMLVIMYSECTYAGFYDISRIYTANEMVLYNNFMYRSLMSSNSLIPTNMSGWEKVSTRLFDIETTKINAALLGTPVVYNNNVAYHPGDIVLHNGYLFVSQVDNNKGNLPQESMLVLYKGNS